MSNNWADPNEVESNAQAPVQGVASSETITTGRGSEAKEVFFQMMTEWFIEFVRTNPIVQWPPSPPTPQLVPPMPQGLDQVWMSQPPIEKLRKFEAEEFYGMAKDDPERVEFWLENTILVLNELSCSPTDCLKYAISLLKDTTYQWWNTSIVVIPENRVTLEFFQT